MLQLVKKNEKCIGIVFKIWLIKGDIMKIIRQLLIIVGILFLSHLVKIAINIPIPAPVLGMIILFLCLLTGIIKVESIELVSQFFLDNLSLFFIPGAVGIIASLDLIKDEWLPILVVVLLSIVIGILVTGFTVQLLKKRRGA